MSGGKWVGQSVKRLEDRRLLTGRGGFIANVEIANLHHAAILRSPHAHADIRRLDVSAALAMAGVIAVLTGEDVRQRSDPFMNITGPVPYWSCAVGTAHFVGEPVAVVVARDRYLAEDALDAIEVDYEPLPAVVDQEAALAPNAPILHDNLGTNLAVRRRFSFGDVDRAFAEADLVVRERYRFPRYSHFPMETYGILASWDAASGLLTVRANFQGPFIIHTVMARALRLRQNRVRVIVPGDIGGGFGLKSSMYPYMVLLALAAMKAGVPVKWIEDRREALTASSSHADRVTYMEAAVRKDGTVLALRTRNIDNVGAYIRTPEPADLFARFSAMTGAYRIRDVALDLSAAMTNTSLTGPVRGYGGHPLYFALERTMDTIAARLGMDPAELRFRNFIGAGEFPYTTATGGEYDSGNYPECLRRLLALARYDELRARQRAARAEGRLFGIGLATIVDPCVTNIGYITLAKSPEERTQRRAMSGSGDVGTVRVDPSGDVVVLATSVPQGQGHETIIAQIVADELGVPIERITVHAEVDTLASVWSITTGSYSSRFSSVGSSAYAMAARQVRAKAVKIAAHVLEVAEEDVEWKDGAAVVRGAPHTALALRAIAGIAHWNQTSLPAGMEPNLQATYAFNLPTSRPPLDDDRANTQNVYGFGAELAVVEVDRASGVVRVLEYYTVHDCGTVLNPAHVRGQVQGAAVQGISGALWEQMRWDESGQYLTAGLQDYLMPTAMEAPDIGMDHVETPSPNTVLGSKGIGEASSMAAPVTVANAVADALAPLGIPVTSLPLWPDTVWRMLKEAQGP
ncbi:MAG: xanthine dehydrogenase family protein molybdopterin-binding subunit [Candidatus Rokubacteria bacterium]|nr:xanthine dehydrogenase family protein molybdopterin-binding subunit [Candidatus Rokubacteria bacterium]